jgi:cell division protein FtsL
MNHPTRHSARWEVRPRGRTRSAPQGILPLLALALLLAGLCFAYLWQAHRLQQLTAAQTDARKELEAAQAVNRTLAIRIEEAFSLARVARIARDQLGMVEPDPASIRYVRLPPSASL